MNYFIQLRGLMIEVMLPLSLLVAAGALWPRVFADAQPDVAELAGDYGVGNDPLKCSSMTGEKFVI